MIVITYKQEQVRCIQEVPVTSRALSSDVKWYRLDPFRISIVSTLSISAWVGSTVWSSTQLYPSSRYSFKKASVWRYIDLPGSLPSALLCKLLHGAHSSWVWTELKHPPRVPFFWHLLASKPCRFSVTLGDDWAQGLVHSQTRANLYTHGALDVEHGGSFISNIV